jgi:ribonuclease G
MKKIFVNENTWQTRIAVTLNNLLENIYFDSHASNRLERSYFKGKITKILPGIQTAFVNIGQERSGFLHISEIDRALALNKITMSDEEIEEDESVKKQSIKKTEININKILTEGQEILVQVSKEPIHSKGAKLTTCFTIPGRFLVLMPNIPRVGISKKIENTEERNRLRDLLKENLPEGMGAIIRTTSDQKDEIEILNDLK